MRSPSNLLFTIACLVSTSVIVVRAFVPCRHDHRRLRPDTTTTIVRRTDEDVVATRRQYHHRTYTSRRRGVVSSEDKPLDDPIVRNNRVTSSFVRDGNDGKEFPQDTERDGTKITATITTANASGSSRRGFLTTSIAAVTSAATLCVASPSPAGAAASGAASSGATAVEAVITTASTCDDAVSVWQRDDRIVYLLGTAHISESSAELAGRLVRDTHPSAVFVELDLQRVAGGNTVRVNPDDGTVTTTTTKLGIDLNNDPSSSSSSSSSSNKSRIVVPQVVPVSQREDGSGTLALAAPKSADTGSPSNNVNNDYDPSLTVPTTTSTSSSSSTTTLPTSKPNWFRRTVTDWGAALVGRAIRGLYSNLGDAGFSPGEEFATAIDQGQAMGSDIVLGDQDVRITLRRLSEALAVTDLNALTDPNSDLERSMAELFGGGRSLPTSTNAPSSTSTTKNRSRDEMKEELTSYVEAMKSRENVRAIMKELDRIAPALVQVMLTERDAYMATGLDALHGYRIVTAVMGIAHQDGVERNLRSFGWKPVTLRCPAK